ncbi:type I-B CRISPR-associated protein Cas5b [Caloranaerobacter sp. DY30410]|uniref:type I-B CRISPR-associated protein Cas5b n=1 Tax=Caloranaerobacter sp. DY30410 TaxID=3238305 RepID=UPI003CFCA0DA
MKRDVLIFDIEGYAAHFRKFYTNSSSLSYSVPPRTVLSGLIAAIMGLERDTYYDDFRRENIFIGVKKNKKTRKIMQTLNYMKITSSKHFQSPEEHTQIPFEIVLGENSYLSYRLYVSHLDKDFIDVLEKRIKEKRYYYSPYLGVVSFSCITRYVDRVIGSEEYSDNIVDISTVIPFNKIKDRGIKFNKTGLFIMKEKMPCEFTEDRNIKTVESYIYDENTNPLSVMLNTNYVKLKYNDIVENIVFM